MDTYICLNMFIDVFLCVINVLGLSVPVCVFTWGRGSGWVILRMTWDRKWLRQECTYGWPNEYQYVLSLFILDVTLSTSLKTFLLLGWGSPVWWKLEIVFENGTCQLLFSLTFTLFREKYSGRKSESILYLLFLDPEIQWTLSKITLDT